MLHDALPISCSIHAAVVEAEGVIGIHVDPPVTVVLDTVGFRVSVMGWYDGCGSTFCNSIGAHQSNCNK